jgi:hypothetical protein
MTFCDATIKGIASQLQGVRDLQMKNGRQFLPVPDNVPVPAL